MFQEFAKTIQLTATTPAVWDAMLDVRRVASWLSIVRDVKDVDPPRQYAAVLEDRLGPFAMRADLAVTVEADADAHRMHVAAAGEDRQVASRISATIDLATVPGSWMLHSPRARTIFSMWSFPDTKEARASVQTRPL